MEKPSFEQRLEQVGSIIQEIESGKMPLEEAVRQYEKGMKSLNELENELGEISRRITVLQENPDGSLTEKNLEAEK